MSLLELLSSHQIDRNEANRPAVHLFVATGNRLKAETIAEALSRQPDVLVFQLSEAFREANLQKLADDNGMKGAPAHDWTAHIASAKAAIQQYIHLPEVLQQYVACVRNENRMRKIKPKDTFAFVTVDTARQADGLRLDKPTDIDEWRRQILQLSGTEVKDVATMHIVPINGGGKITGQVVTTSELRNYTPAELDEFIKGEGYQSIKSVAGGISLYRPNGRSMHDGEKPLTVDTSVNGKALRSVIYQRFGNVEDTTLRGLIFAAPVVKPLIEALQWI